jgi:hypothetical protein
VICLKDFQFFKNSILFSYILNVKKKVITGHKEFIWLAGDELLKEPMAGGF